MATEGCRRAVTSSFSHSFSRLFLGPWLLLLSPSWEGSQGGLQLAAAKLVGGPVRLSGPRQEYHWRYLSKFGYDIGTGSYSVRLQLHQPKTIAAEAPVQIEIYLDEVWPAVEAEKDVCARKALAKQVLNITVGSDGNWSAWLTGSLSQSVRPHIWYFAVSDCDKSLQNFTHRLKFEFHALQENGSEFSIEMRGMLLCNSLFLACFTVFIWFFVQRTLDFNRKTGNVHPVIWVLAIGMLTQYLAQVFHTLHLWAYKFDGDGIKPLEVLSEILFMLSQVTQTSLLILIGLGYTLLQSRIGELDLMIPMCFMVGVIHIMLVGFGKIKDDAAYKFHENEGPVGWILLTMRLLLYGWFLWAVQASARDGGSKVRNFLDQFRIAGSIYFLAYPTIFLAAKMFAPYLQHGVMSVGLMLMQ
ncbi:unnamed protein product, partial [Polarella glacialis]